MKKQQNTKTRPRSPNGVNVHRFLEEFSVKVQPCHTARVPRPANIVFGGRTISRLLRKDVERCRTVILCIKASNPTSFEEGIIWAVWRFITAHAASLPRQHVVDMFAAVDLAELHARAQRLANGQSGRMGKTSEKLSTLLADRLLAKDIAV